MADRQYKKEFSEHLRTLLSAQRLARFDEVMAKRTRYVTLVLHDMFHSQNASAVLRTAECFGIQDVHVVEQNCEYDIQNKISRGSEKWLTTYRYEQLPVCAAALKEKGYKIALASVQPQSKPLHQLPLDQPVALYFGGEHGLHPEAHQYADYHFTIPMRGFTESFNISVSAGICLQWLTHRMEEQNRPWPLSADEHHEVLISWMQKSFKGFLVEKAIFDTQLKGGETVAELKKRRKAWG